MSIKDDMRKRSIDGAVKSIINLAEEAADLGKTEIEVYEAILLDDSVQEALEKEGFKVEQSSRIVSW